MSYHQIPYNTEHIIDNVINIEDIIDKVIDRRRITFFKYTNNKNKKIISSIVRSSNKISSKANIFF